MKPKKKCVITYESTFSVTGFLTFTVVAASAVANVIANINNNNDNNNNNNNQDNVNNNNQMSNSADAENQGNARHFWANSSLLPEAANDFYCYVALRETPAGQFETLMTSLLGFIMADFIPGFEHEKVAHILDDQQNHCLA